MLIDNASSEVVLIDNASSEVVLIDNASSEVVLLLPISRARDHALISQQLASSCVNC